MIEVIPDDAPPEPVQSLFQDFAIKLRGPFTDIRFHLPYLFEVAIEYPDMQVLELGTRDGNSTAAFLAAAEAVGGVVHSVDIQDPDIPDKIISRWIASKHWDFNKASDMQITTITTFDVIFIDTSHELYHTIDELRKFYPMLKPGGKLLLHDTEWVGLDSPGAQHMLASKGWGPVAWALDWFCDYEHGRKVTWINHSGSYGLGEIRKPKDASS